MWDYNLSQRLLKVKQKKREIERSKKKYKKDLVKGLRFIKLHCSVRFEHVFGEDSDFFPTAVFLHETSNEKLRIFSSVALESYQFVELHFPVLSNMLVSAEVMWCDLFSLNPRIFHQNPMYYRAELSLNFNSEEEKLRFKAHLEEQRVKYSAFIKPV